MTVVISLISVWGGVGPAEVICMIFVWGDV